MIRFFPFVLPACACFCLAATPPQSISPGQIKPCSEGESLVTVSGVFVCGSGFGGAQGATGATGAAGTSGAGLVYVTAPVASAFALVNPGAGGGAALAQSGTSVMFRGYGDVGDAAHMAMVAAPATPYVVSACFVALLPHVLGVSGFGSGVGFVWSNGVLSSSLYQSLLVFSRTTGVGFGLYGSSSGFTVGSAVSWANMFYGASLPLPFGGPICVALQDDGTTKKVAVSADNESWVVLASEARAVSFVPTRVGIVTDSNGSGAGVMQLVHWLAQSGTLF
jgi:hypothetical protein